jgi:hypothetical protein
VALLRKHEYLTRVDLKFLISKSVPFEEQRTIGLAQLELNCVIFTLPKPAFRSFEMAYATSGGI